MTKLNYTKLMKEAAAKEISPHLLAKRKLNYRKAVNLEPTCKKCKFMNKETVKDGHGQCQTIGEGFDIYSQINLKYTCNACKVGK